MTDLITTVTATAALVFGFALCCVIGVVYLLSKRQINVVQNNSTSVTATERTDSGSGGPGRIERFLIKWAFIGLLAAIVVVTLANAVTASFPAQRASIGNPQPQPAAIATPAPLPTVSAPAALLPASSPVERSEDGGGREGVSPLTIIVPILILAAVAIWVYAIILMSASLRTRAARLDALSTKRTATRAEHLESIIPDAVNQL